MRLKTDKNVTRDDKRRTAVVDFGKCRWEKIKDKRGGEKCKPTKRSKCKVLLKKEIMEDVWNGGKAKRLLKKCKESEKFSIRRLNIYFKSKLFKFLTKFPILKNSSLLSVTW